jgi:glucuronate isomerase
MRRLVLDDDRALPPEPVVRGSARQIHAATRDLPLVCMHGHIDAQVLAENRAFADPASLLVVPDHYVVRMLVSAGIRPEELGVRPRDGGNGWTETDPRKIWRRFCENWHLFRGTPTRYWLEHELAVVFDAPTYPSAETADLLFDHLSERLARPEFLPRPLFEQFGIEVLATTDSALSTLHHHTALQSHGWGGRVIPTFRPDALLHIGHNGWPAEVDRLGELTGTDPGSYAGFLAALRIRRQDFIAQGALATDHGHLSADTTPLSDREAARTYEAARRGDATHDAAAAFTGHMLHQMAAMSCEDGLVMQLHPGVLRDHDTAARALYGPDIGFDIPIAAEFTRSLRPLLGSFGRDPRFRIIVFTVDETTYARELAPLAGVYPAMRLGAPWWFLDSGDGMRRFRESVTETAGFYNTSGFVDDTRAFASIPARHDLARRIDAGYLARLVSEHRISLEEAVETAIDLAYRLPTKSYARPAPVITASPH